MPATREPLVADVVRELAAALVTRGWTLAVAESCTGGGVGAALTDQPGSSAYFLGGVIAYDNRLKASLLGVSEDLIRRVGAVSLDVAEQMADGCRARVGADLAVSITGIAGPGGGSQAKASSGLIGPRNPRSSAPAVASMRARTSRIARAFCACRPAARTASAISRSCARATRSKVPNRRTSSAAARSRFASFVFCDRMVTTSVSSGSVEGRGGAPNALTSRSRNHSALRRCMMA